MDTELLNRWFKKGYSSREMATFLLMADQADNILKLKRPKTLAEKWEQLHDEICKIIYAR
jgi:hypothetical protein